ncbi:MAG: HYR domain-containing protein, partial [Planctomycetes bacterium]|nr:HYR domain-containing protein [Planctomycetota bacterium]
VEFPLPVGTEACGGNGEGRCAPPSGGIFPLGVTTVICMARDEAGNISNCSFTVEVVDETPPVIECIDDIVLQCTSLDGAVVNYSPPQVATECAGDAVVVCDPPPGTLFAPGTTTVRCRAVAAAGNSDSCTFEVTVLCADELRGDSNSDGEINISDVSFTLLYLYRGGSVPPCLAASDSNGNGSVNIVDVIFTLSYLFRGGVEYPDLLTCDL